MEFLELPAEESAVRRHVEELGLPFQRALAAATDAHELADDVDVFEEEVDFRMDRVASEDVQVLVAIDGGSDESKEQTVAETDGNLVGFVQTEVDEAPDAFDRPDRLVICDIYVDEGYRGEGLARDLMERAAERAHEEGCAELRLDVDVDNDRAIAFYEKLGFETLRERMVGDVNDLA